MPTWDEALALMELNDLGFLYMVIMLAIGTVVGIYLADRRAWVRSALRWGASGAVPIGLAIINPLAGLASAGAALATLVRVKVHDPLPWIVGLAAIVRVPGLFSSLWFDEAFSNRVISLPNFGQLWPAIMADVHPPLYYLLMQPFAALTDAPALLRLTSLIVGLWGIVLVWRLVHVLNLGERVAVVAALTWALLPAAIYYSTELRSYALMVNLVLAMMLAIIQDRPKRWVIWVSAICWLHNAGIFYAAVFGLAALLWHGRRWLKPVLIGAAISAVWLPFLFMQASNVAADHWAYINAGMVFWPVVTMTVGNQGELAGLVSVVITVITLTALIRMHRVFRTRYGLLLLAAIFAVPIIEVVLSIIWRPTYIWRHMLPSALLLAIPWAWLAVESRAARLALAPTIAAALISLYGVWYPLARPDYRALLAATCEDATVAYATSINAAFLLSENSAMPVQVWPGAQDNGKSIRIEDVNRFGYGVTPLPRGRVCMLEIRIPASAPAEREFIESTGARLVAEWPVGDWHVYYVWRVENAGI